MAFSSSCDNNHAAAGDVNIVVGKETVAVCSVFFGDRFTADRFDCAVSYCNITVIAVNACTTCFGSVDAAALGFHFAAYNGHIVVSIDTFAVNGNFSVAIYAAACCIDSAAVYCDISYI